MSSKLTGQVPSDPESWKGLTDNVNAMSSKLPINEKQLVWLPYELTADLEVEMQIVFSHKEYASVLAAISASAIADTLEERLLQMRATAAFFQTLSKEVLLPRC